MPATAVRRIGRRLAQGDRASRGIDRWTWARIGIVAAAVLIALGAVQQFGRPYSFFDLKIYHGAVLWWANGGELYDFIAPDTTLGYTYPPFAALTMLPMAGMSMVTAGWLTVLASLAALAAVLWVCLVPIADRYGLSRWLCVAVAVPVAAATEPVRETLGFGQVNLLLFALVMADLVALRRRARAGHQAARRWRTGPGRAPVLALAHRFWATGAWAGVGIGLATAVKLTPALFILYLLVTRQWRPVLTAVGTALTATVVAFVLAGPESARYFGSVLWQTDRVGVADMTPNQSLAGLLARLYDSPDAPGLLWLTFSVLILAVGLSRAANAHADGDELAAFALVGLTANVISPISWSHHLVFVIPAVIVLADQALRRRAAGRGLIGRGSGGANPPWISLRAPVRFPALIGLRHALAAGALYLLFLVSPIWRYEHHLPQVSHYASGVTGVLGENSLIIALIVLVAALPWRPGAEPAFYTESPHRRTTTAIPVSPGVGPVSPGVGPVASPQATAPAGATPATGS